MQRTPSCLNINKQIFTERGNLTTRFTQHKPSLTNSFMVIEEIDYNRPQDQSNQIVRVRLGGIRKVHLLLLVN